MKISLLKSWGLVIFDIIGLAIGGYAFLLFYQLKEVLPNAAAFTFLMAIFIMIKVLILSLYNLNRKFLLKNIPFIGGLISIIGNLIVFGIGFFYLKDIAISFFIELALVDFLIVSLCHFLWWILIGKDETIKKEAKDEAKKAEEKKTWLADEEDEEAEYDTIFSTLLENEKKRTTAKMVTKTNTESDSNKSFSQFDADKRYQTSEFLKDIKKTLAKEPQIKEKILEESQKKAKENEKLPEIFQIPTEPLWKAPQEPMGVLNKSRKNSETIPMPSKLLLEKIAIDEKITTVLPKISFAPKMQSEITKNTLSAPKPAEKPKITAPVEKSQSKKLEQLLQNDRSGFVTSMPQENQKKSLLPKKKEPEIKKEIKFDKETEKEEDFISIEKRLDYLFSDIERSMEETHKLQGDVSDFHKEVGSYIPITGDKQIIATGTLIREKLKAVIDKQFVVDEVLDDLIRLSKLINKRIGDLDVIETGLNQRKKALEQKEASVAEKRNKNAVDADIEIMPEEVVLEHTNSEFIVTEGDYNRVRKYLIEDLKK